MGLPKMYNNVHNFCECVENYIYLYISNFAKTPNFGLLMDEKMVQDHGERVINKNKLSLMHI